MSKISVAHLCLEGDPVGVSWLLHEALRDHGVDSRHILLSKKQVHNQQQGHDLFVGDNYEDAENAYHAIRDADIVHINQALPDVPKFDVVRFLKGKPFVFHNHGGYHLLNPEIQLKRLKSIWQDFTYIGCGPITKHIIPQMVWMPSIVPLYREGYLPVEREFGGTLKVCHKVFSQQAKMYKGSDVIVECVNDFLRNFYAYDIHLDFFHDMPLMDTLNKSAHHHVCVDNTTQGFIGMSGWESLSKAQVVVARLDPVADAEYKALGNGSHPIMNVSGMDEMCKVLRDLHDDRDFLKKKCMESRKWMETFYTPERIAQRYIDVYKKTIEKFNEGEAR